jgi:hypothetical protein
MKVWVILVAVVVILIIAAGYRTVEKFMALQSYDTYDNTEFRGMNMMGVNSVDTHIATATEADCAIKCARNEVCAGYSYYKPGNRCYLYSSGGLVFGRRGFRSGLKL